MSSEETASMTLWLLMCENGSKWLETTYFYAASHEEAQEKAQR